MLRLKTKIKQACSHYGYWLAEQLDGVNRGTSPIVFGSSLLFPKTNLKQALNMVLQDKKLCYILLQYTFVLRRNIMSVSTVFTNNRTQAVRLPADVRMPEDVKQVTVRAKGKERIIAPLQSSWDSFFMADTQASDDFMLSRATQTQPERESLE